MHAEATSGERPAFHSGEVALQREAGVAERLARVGPQVIRSHLPAQHRDFFAQLPLVIVGSIDSGGQPTASLLAAPPGFISSPEERSLRIDALPLLDDPLQQNLEPGAALGLLGIQAHTRRRSRANGRVSARDASGFSLAIDQSFGNCPKYIVPREAVYVGSAWRGGPKLSDTLDDAARALLRGADTFYIASAHPGAASGGVPVHGVDVSHRGGPAGFVRVIDAVSFSVPNYRGNNFYNTLGNLSLHAAAGLLFMDFVRGDLLQLEVLAEVVVDTESRAGAEATGRSVRFQLRRARFFPGASRLRWLF